MNTTKKLCRQVRVQFLQPFHATEVALLHALVFHGVLLQQTSRRPLAGFQSEVHVPKPAVKITITMMIYSQSNVFSDLGEKKPQEDYEPKMRAEWVKW